MRSGFAFQQLADIFIGWLLFAGGKGSRIRFHGSGARGETGTQRGEDGTAEAALKEAGADELGARRSFYGLRRDAAATHDAAGTPSLDSPPRGKQISARFFRCHRKSLIDQAFQGNPGAIRPPVFPIHHLAR